MLGFFKILELLIFVVALLWQVRQGSNIPFAVKILQKPVIQCTF